MKNFIFSYSTFGEDRLHQKYWRRNSCACLFFFIKDKPEWIHLRLTDAKFSSAQIYLINWESFLKEELRKRWQKKNVWILSSTNRIKYIQSTKIDHSNMQFLIFNPAVVLGNPAFFRKLFKFKLPHVGIFCLFSCLLFYNTGTSDSLVAVSVCFFTDIVF